MALYECYECGEEYGNFPKVFLAVNSDAPKYPGNNHETEFEITWEEFDRFLSYEKKIHSVKEVWEKFWSWLGDRKLRWFCSIECAEHYLAKNRDGTPNIYRPEYDEQKGD